MLSESVEVYLDGGSSTSVSSTIVDATRLIAPGGTLSILREGAISREQIRDVIGDLLEEEPPADGVSLT
jgi:tRNA A37 threonylcarbamoyladenosine synthetase subunit TsaC/SUA5/YrdC